MNFIFCELKNIKKHESKADLPQMTLTRVVAAGVMWASMLLCSANYTSGDFNLHALAWRFLRLPIGLFQWNA